MKFKKIFYLLFASLMLFAISCSDDTPEIPEIPDSPEKPKEDPDVPAPKTFEVNILLNYPQGYEPMKDVTVTLTNKNNNKVIESETDANGFAKFTVLAGVYDASVTEKRTGDAAVYVLSAIANSITVTDSWDASKSVKLTLEASKLNQVVIKEVFYGGTPKDDGSGAFIFDSYVVLYNNSEMPASLDNICFAMTLPYNPHATNRDYRDGKLYYEAENWVPAGQAFWHFQKEVTLEPYQDIVIALRNAVDNTKTYSQSINFANPEYYCTYDIDVFNHKFYYPAPSEAIPSSHYLKAEKYGMGTAWAFSVFGPAFFIFAPKGETVAQFAADETNKDLYGGFDTQIRKKVPVDWVVDGVEIFLTGNNKNKKRLNSVIDAGYIYGTRGEGYSIYRNVDKEATEAIKENEGKIVYNYALGTTDIEGGSTDPSKIDAEASIKNGAKIVYLDTNDSSKDFHQRVKASLRD